jgi:hypothetical protein
MPIMGLGTILIVESMLLPAWTLISVMMRIILWMLIEPTNVAREKPRFGSVVWILQLVKAPAMPFVHRLLARLLVPSQKDEDLLTRDLVHLCGTSRQTELGWISNARRIWTRRVEEVGSARTDQPLGLPPHPQESPWSQNAN